MLFQLLGEHMSTEQLAQELFEQTKDIIDNDKRFSIVKASPEPVRRAYYKIRKDSFFVPENACLDKRQEYRSPSGKYKLVVTPYHTTPGSWDFSQGLVYNGDKLIAEIRRNYASFPFAWVEYHPKGSFLICGEDYQGQSVVNLCSGEVLHSRPEEANIGSGFCWASIHPSPSQQILAVSGCYWACPYEVVFYDFSDPMTMPWPTIDSSDYEFLEWSDCDDKDKAIIGRKWEVCTLEGPLNGKGVDDLTNEELDFVYKEAKKQNLTEDDFYQLEDDPQSIWTRPTNFQIARKRILDLAWRKEKNLPMLQGWVDLIEYWIRRCSPEQIAELETEHEDLLGWFRSNVVSAQELWPTK